MKTYTPYPAYIKKCWVCDRTLSPKPSTNPRAHTRKHVNAKTCSARCRKTLSRLQKRESELYISLEKCDMPAASRPEKAKS